MHESFFSYTIVRPYPYKWFTPVALVGGLIAIVLVSFINFATSGYELVAISSSNPNRTVEGAARLGNIKWPKYFIQNSQASCASTTLPLNSEVYTTNHALSYKLTSIWRENNGTSDFLGSLVYHNNLLRDCNTTEVRIQILNRFTQRPALTARASAGVLLRSFTTCAVDTVALIDETSGRTFFRLEGSFQDGETNSFLSDNATTKASLHWGNSLLRFYWKLLSKAWYDSANNDDVPNKQFYGEISLTRQAGDSKGSREEVISDSFFRVGCFVEFGFCAEQSISQLSRGRDYTAPYPNIWHGVDTLGKAMWFTTMTDLGQNDSVTGIPNMLAYGDLLESLTSNYTNELQYFNKSQRESKGDFGINWSPYHPSLETESFNASKSPQPALGASPGYLSTNYICQVPKAKSAGTLFFSILIADLVLLQALWIGFKLIVDVISEKRNPSMAYCVGCHGKIIL